MLGVATFLIQLIVMTKAFLIVILDTASPNSHGKALIDFLKCTNMCILNGRFEGDAFTSVSTKGLSVVDYCLVRMEDFSKFADFKVHNMLGLECRQ